jgi:hypothetical protein
MPVRKDWSPMIRSISLSLGVLVVIGTFVLAANVKKKAAAESVPPRVLMIGDSLSVGGFGEVLRQHLENKYGEGNVFFFASCGSSPENWLKGEPVFHTKCGYREHTPSTDVYRDYNNGRPPPLTATPKLETLLAKYHPTIVTIQQGTNWMDRNLSDDQIRSFINRFLGAVHRSGVRRVIWIGPPDSSRFSKVQGRIYRLIRAEAPSGDYVINSRRYTHYVPGKTGGDGIHYNKESGEAWAKQVITQCDSMLPPKPTRKVAAAE